MKTIKKQNKRISLLLLSLFSMIRADGIVMGDESDALPSAQRFESGKGGDEQIAVQQAAPSEEQRVVKKAAPKKEDSKKYKEVSLKERFPEKKAKYISEKEMRGKSPKDAYLDLVKQVEEIFEVKELFYQAKAEKDTLESPVVKEEYDKKTKEVESLPLTLSREYGRFAAWFHLAWFEKGDKKKACTNILCDYDQAKAYVAKYKKDVKYLDNIMKNYEKAYDVLLQNLSGLVNKTDKKSPKDAGVEAESLLRCQAAFDLADYEYRGSKIADSIKPSIDEKMELIENFNRMGD